MPAFVVTLAGYLLWFGVMIIILGPPAASASRARCCPTSRFYGIVYAYIDPLVAWIGLVVIVGLIGGVRSGCATPAGAAAAWWPRRWA